MTDNRGMKMVKKTIVLKDFNSVKEFVAITSTKPYDIELIYNDKSVNAKDINALFSLDLTKPLVLAVHKDSAGELLLHLRKFIVKDK